MRIIVIAALLIGCSANDDIPKPMISSVVPNRAPAGSVVVLSGDYFCQLPDVDEEDPVCENTGSVQFGTTPGTPSSWTDTTIMVEVPQGVLGENDISVVAAGRRSNDVDFFAE